VYSVLGKVAIDVEEVMMLSFAIPVALYIFFVNDAYVFIEQGVSSKSKKCSYKK
jgi:hypothetical protein